MKIKQKIISLITPVLIVAGIMAVPVLIGADFAMAADCGVPTSIIDCPGVNNNTNDITNSGLWAVLLIGINILTALVGVAALGGFLYGAVLYTTAQGDQGKAQKALEVFRNVAIGIVAYALMYVGLNFIIPGGVFA